VYTDENGAFHTVCPQDVVLIEGPIDLGVPILGGHTVQASGLAPVTINAPTAAGNSGLEAQGLAVGDTMVAMVSWTDAVNLAAPTGTPGWTTLVPKTNFGTRAFQILARQRQAGDPNSYPFVLGADRSHRASIAVVRGARPPSEWEVGTVCTRAGGCGASSTTCVAPALAVDLGSSRVISISSEATTAGSGIGELVSVTNSDLWFFAEQGGAGSQAIETLAAATVALDESDTTDPVTFTYQNAQSSNGAAVQISAPGIVLPSGGWKKADLLADSPFLVAHRCHGGWWPENTLYAARQSAYADKCLDIDVWRSSDGVFVCSHDQSTLRMTGVDLDIPTTPWATLAALMNQADECVDVNQPLRPMARLEQILDEFIDSHVLSIEMKGPSTAIPEFLDLLDSYEAYGAHDRIIYQGFAGGQSQLTAVKARGYTTWANAFDAEIDTASWFGANVDLVGLNWDATVAQWNTAVGYGKPVIGHVISTKAQADQALARGADGLTISRW
jgi:glycerophosphoryl diester phosphodiesterase